MIVGSFFGFSIGGGGTPTPPTSLCWALNGNTVGSQKYFGTNDNFSIPIYTNGISRGVFDNSGNFGFGISSGLTSRVYIQGVDSTSSNYALKIDNLAAVSLLSVRNDGFATILDMTVGRGGGLVATNTVLGVAAIANASGGQNTGVGYAVLNTLNTGTSNTAIGYAVLANITSGTTNVGIGASAMQASNPSYSVGIGGGVLYQSSGTGNSGIGHGNFYNLSSGNYNTALGYNAGANIMHTQGNNNLFLGYMADVSVNNLTNASAIGANATVGASNSMVLGNNVNVGIGISIPLAKLHLQGIDSTSSNYSLKVDNSASSPLFYVRNDGYTGIGIATPVYQLDVKSLIDNNGIRVQAPDFAVLNVSSNTLPSLKFTNISGSSTPLMLRGEVSGDGIIDVENGLQFRNVSNNIFARTDNTNINPIWRFGNGSTFVSFHTDTRMTLETQDNTSASYGIRVVNQLDSTLFCVLGNGNSGFGTPSPTATIHAKGIDSTLANYAFKSDNSALSPLLYVRNDGNVGISATPVVNSRLQINNSSFGNASICLGGSDYFGIDSNTTGLSLLLGVNTGNNKQLWLADQDKLASNATNPILQFGLFGTSPSAINAISTNGSYLDLVLQSNGGNLGVGTGTSTPLARAHVLGSDATTLINQRLEPATGVTEDTSGGTINTTDATANVTAQTIAVPTDKVISLESTIVYRKTGGAGVGTTGDGTTIKLNSSVRNVAGTLTLDTVQNTYTGTVNAILGAVATYTISGANVLISVTGLLNDNITWNVITKVNTVA